MRIATAAAVVFACAIAAQVSAGEVITGNSQIDEVLAQVPRAGAIPGFEIYSDWPQLPAGVFTRLHRAMWKVIQKIDPWNLPGTLSRWPVRIYYLNSETARRAGMFRLALCTSNCGEVRGGTVFMALILGHGNLPDRFTFYTEGGTHEMAHLFLFRAADHSNRMWGWTEFPGWSPGLITLGRWIVGRTNERFGLNQTPPAVSEARFNQILQVAREEMFAGWPETVFDAPSYLTHNTWYEVWQWTDLGPLNDDQDQIRAAMYIAAVVVARFNNHRPGTERAYSAAIAAIVAEVEQECARDGAC